MDGEVALKGNRAHGLRGAVVATIHKINFKVRQLKVPDIGKIIDVIRIFLKLD